jgi:hypothetical protein
MELHLEALTPEARAAVEKLVRESGKPLAEVLSEFVVRGAEQSARAENGAARSRDEQENAWEKFLAAGRMHAKTLPERHVVDDSRESIYSGRGWEAEGGAPRKNSS